MDVFFLFRDRLPSDPYDFSNPSELYASVEEPFTVYYPPDEAREMTDLLSTSSAGFGVRLDSVGPGFVIEEVFPNSPAEDAGLQENDTIVEIDGREVSGMSPEQLSSLIRGEVGETRTVTVKRDSEVLNFTVTLDTFLSPSVFTDSLEQDIAYIYISAFFSQTIQQGGTAAEFNNALDDTEWAQMTIIDLRNNPGGEVQQVIPVISQFMSPQTPIIQTTERVPVQNSDSGETLERTWTTIDIEAKGIDRDFIILVNEATASASEIMLSALHENRPDITTIGVTTFGKARGQAMTLTPDSGLAVVTYAMLRPINGEPYDMSGIDPDITVQFGEDPLEVALEVARRELGRYSFASAQSILRRARHHHSALMLHNRRPMTIIHVNP
ncbi:carboxyl-terminal protease [Chitinispirillum alkaliphilum]|nr:carboxyl-terminal protease [Chitinispirillum alkaliphilum]